jgi:cell wall-associated NlpC family hydrolase
MGAVVVKVGAVLGVWFFLTGNALAALTSFHSWQHSQPPAGQVRVWPPATVAPNVQPVPELTVSGAQAVLLDTAMSYLVHSSVPYVWGGNSIGDSDTCTRCATCMIKNKKRGVRKRHLRCGDCSRCGLDCSHFVQKVFADAGLHYPFVTTATMMKPNLKRPDLIPGLRFISTDLRDARPGDLLVLRRHVVILALRHEDGTADVIHVSRAVRNTLVPKVGGIEYRRRVNLKKFYGGLRRILRHEKLHSPEPQRDQTPALDLLKTLAQAPVPPGA